MKRRSLRIRAILRISIVLAILILVNVISVRLFGRIDMTSKKIFTLSDASRDLMSSLDDRVTIKAYFTEDLPAPYNNHRRVLLDQLNEYRAYSGGNLQFEFINPSGEKGEQEAMQQGILQAQVQALKEDKFEVKRAYMGMVFLYEDRKELIPIIQNPASLEYDISTTIKRLVTQTRKKIGFVSGHGEPPLTELGRVQELLQKQYEVTSVELNTPIPADIAALMVVAPKSKFTDTEKLEIDQYIMRGGKVAFLLNKVEADLQQRFGRQAEIGLEDLLENYGMRLNADLVRDVQCANISIVQQQFGFSMQSQVPFPYLPLASDFSKENVIVKDLQGVVIFFGSSVDTTQVSSRGLQAEILLRSSKKSGRQTQFFMLDPLQRFTEADFAEQSIPLGVVVTGQFKSAFANKQVLSDTSGLAVTPPLTVSPETRIVLIGDGDFARDQYLGNRDNLTMFANIVDYLVDDAGLITIRSKDVTLAPLEQVSDETKPVLKLVNLIVPPALVVLLGLFRWRMRKVRKETLEQH